jgi:hypothetical protein
VRVDVLEVVLAGEDEVTTLLLSDNGVYALVGDDGS